MNLSIKTIYLIATTVLFHVVCTVPINPSSQTDIPLVTFDGAEATTFKFHALNDPVMGGVSVGSWELDEVQGIGIFNGTVKDVPALSAPGFLSAYARGQFNDASTTISGDLVLKVRTSTASYTGFRVSFAAGTLSPLYACSNGGQAPLSNGCFKSRFEVPPGDEFVEVRVPFSSFSDHWNPATGDQTISCVDDPTVCPTEKDLSHIQWIEVWAEGVGGDIHLEIESISASDQQHLPNIISHLPYIPTPYLPTPYKSHNSKENIDVEEILKILSKLPYIPTPYLPTPNEDFFPKTYSNQESNSNTVPNIPYNLKQNIPSPNNVQSPKEDIDVEELLKVMSKLPYVPTPYLPTPNEPYHSEDENAKKSISNLIPEQAKDGINVEELLKIMSKLPYIPTPYLPTPNEPYHSKDDNAKEPISNLISKLPYFPTSKNEPFISLVTFDDAPSTTHEFTQLNDPVMGGVSVGTWSVNEEGAYGIMNGTVKDVPFLSAPGFIKAASYYRTGKFNDASDAIDGDLILTVRSSTAGYTGFRISIAAGTLSPEYSCASGGVNPLSGGCFKAKYSIEAGDEFSEVRIPFNMFSDHWSPATGEQTVTCAEDPKVCPTAEDLAGIKSIEIWAEGVKGDVHLEIRSIAAGVKSTT